MTKKFLIILFSFGLINLSPIFVTKIKSKTSKTFVPGQIIVTLKEGASLETPSIAALNREQKAKETESAISYISKVAQEGLKKKQERIIKIKFDEDKNINEIIAEYEKNPDVEKAEPNYLAQINLTPNDTNFATQYNLEQASDKDMDATSAWNITTGDSNTIVAVLDSGFDTDHADFAAQLWSNPGEAANGLDDDGNTLVDDLQGWDWVGIGHSFDESQVPEADIEPNYNGIDDDGDTYIDYGVTHGTVVSGQVGAVTNNATGIAAVGYGTTVMGLRVADDEGYATYADIISGINYAVDKGADIISMSLSGPYSSIFDTALENAYDNDVVVAAAAGNGGLDFIGDDLDQYPQSPVCNDGIENWVIGVAAVNSSDVKPTYSNYGKVYVDISAAGVGVPSINYHNPPDYNNEYANGGGTSIATPQVAAGAALLKAQFPAWSGAQVRDRLIASTDTVSAQNPSYAGKLGAGRLNINNALRTTDVRRHPSGPLIKTSSSGAIYLLEDGTRRHILSMDIFYSHFGSMSKILNIPVTRMNAYPYGPELLFRDGSVAKGSGGAIYAIENETKRHITSPAVFAGLGYTGAHIIHTTNSILNKYGDGADINATGSHVSGSVVKTASSGILYVLEGSDKRHIVNMSAYNAKFKYAKIVTISDVEMATYGDGADYCYDNGEVLKGSSTAAYLISYGTKRHIASFSTFQNLSYTDSFVRYVTDAVLATYSTGPQID